MTLYRNKFDIIASILKTAKVQRIRHMEILQKYKKRKGSDLYYIYWLLATAYCYAVAIALNLRSDVRTF